MNKKVFSILFLVLLFALFSSSVYAHSPPDGVWRLSQTTLYDDPVDPHSNIAVDFNMNASCWIWDSSQHVYEFTMGGACSDDYDEVWFTYEIEEYGVGMGTESDTWDVLELTSGTDTIDLWGPGYDGNHCWVKAMSNQSGSEYNYLWVGADCWPGDPDFDDVLWDVDITAVRWVSYTEP